MITSVNMVEPVLCTNCGTIYDITKMTYCPYCSSTKYSEALTACSPLRPNPLAHQESGNHYKRYKIQPVEFCQANQLNYCESNVIKYVVRHRDKNGLEDLKKARHYIDLLIQLEYEQD